MRTINYYKCRGLHPDTDTDTETDTDMESGTETDADADTDANVNANANAKGYTKGAQNVLRLRAKAKLFMKIYDYIICVASCIFHTPTPPPAPTFQPFLICCAWLLVFIYSTRHSDAAFETNNAPAS